mgnify:FL=1
MFDEPVATDVQPDIASPILPQPFPFIKTVVEPVAIGAACDGQGEPGKRCEVLLSPSLDMPVPFTITLGLNADLFGTEQCDTSASTELPLHIAGTFYLH